MTFNELQEEYIKMCRKNPDCYDCKYNGNSPCGLKFGYQQGRADALNEILNEMRKSPFASDKATFVKKYIDEQLKENDNE